MEKRSRVVIAACLASAFIVSLPSAVSAKRVHDPQVETKVEMHRLNDSERNVQPDAGHRSLNDRIAAILHPPVVAKAPVVTAAGDDAILGSPVATQEQCVRYLLSMNPSPELTVPPQELVAYYYEEGGREGIRPDVAFAQALKETGYFRYGGTVTPDQNNYCGLGTTSAAVKGAYFSSARLGVRAHIQHLLAYASTRRPAEPVVDPRYDLVRANYGMDTIGNWAGLNGRWAVPGYSYGQSILQLFNNILQE